MNKSELQLMFGYNRWANAKILAACLDLPEADLYATQQLSFDSIYGTLLHIYGAELLWRARLQSAVSIPAMPVPEDFDGFSGLQKQWQAEEAAMQRFLDDLPDGSEQRVVEFPRLTGELESATTWRALLHVAFHSMQFRAEAATALSRLGHSPGNIDLLYYLRETNQR